MAHIVENKYYLKNVHEEIDLFDRKLAHILNFESFDNEAERDAAAHRLTVKRNALVMTARRLADKGIEYNQNELPRSLRPKDAPGVTAPQVVEAAPKGEKPFVPVRANRRVCREYSPFAGTSLDWRLSMQHYMQKKAKV
jgi:hypothetical protein